jgi:hypothetical protein
MAERGNIMVMGNKSQMIADILWDGSLSIISTKPVSSLMCRTPESKAVLKQLKFQKNPSWRLIQPAGQF